MKNEFDPRVFLTAVRLEAGEPISGGITMPLLGQLLKMQGESFIMQAYRVFLGRNADASALSGYAAQANSLPGRILLLLALSLSPERRRLNPTLLKTLRKLGQILRRRVGK